MFQRFIISTAILFTTVLSYSQTVDSISNDVDSVQFVAPVTVDETPVVDYANPVEYEVGGVTVSGIQFIDPTVLISMSGFVVGRKIIIPSDEITKIIDKFWNQGLFSEVKISITKVVDGKVFLDIYLKERPRLSKFVMKGISKSDADDITEKLKIKPGVQVTDNLLNNINIVVKKHYAEKGFLKTNVDLVMKDDSVSRNRVLLTAQINKNKKVKIVKIQFIGNKNFTNKRLRKTLKKTKQKDYNFFTGAKFIESKFKEDKKKLEEFYSKNGYRDFKILNDSISYANDNEIELFIRINEGNQYYIRNVSWVGNTIYPDEVLNKYFKMKKGDVYDQVSMDKRLTTDEDAVNSLYLDNGYLFFRLTPVETKIEGDSIDVEMRINEGRQATLNNIIISGNTKTNEHVVRRELRTRPGELFSKSNIIRSVRELAQLGHFDPEKITPDVIPNPSEGNVDIHYKLVEKPNDQLEVSGGWGANMLVGTIGIRFSNFSVRNFFKTKEWRPVPSGDGQSLSIRAQSNGTYYRSYNISFVEPWLGGKKRNSLQISAYLSKMYNTSYNYLNGGQSGSSDQWYKVTGASVGLGKMLKWPDDWFSLYGEFSYQLYTMHKYALFNWVNEDGSGKSNNLSFTTTLSRNSQDQPIYPRTGSNYSLSLQVTPPYSYLRSGDIKTQQEHQYDYIEFYKWKFKANTYNMLAKDLVLSLGTQIGYLGKYNKNLNSSPFEGFQVGGSGMTGYQMYGTEVVALRGYEDQGFNDAVGARNLNMYVKYTMELRYPITLQQSASIYALSFLEAGNAWYDYSKFNPFNIYRSAGIGIRAFLPMFGLLGIDWGYGFDNLSTKGSTNNLGGSHFHFVIGQQF